MLCDTEGLPGKDVASVNKLLDRGMDGILLAYPSDENNRASECAELCQTEGAALF